MATRLIAALLGLLAGADAAFPAFAVAASCSWTGAGADNKWSTPANWVGCGPSGHPVNGDQIGFPNGAARGVNENDLVGLSVRVIAIRGASALPAETRWSISGMPVIVTEGLDVANTPPEANGVGSSFLAPLILGANVTVSNKFRGGPVATVDLGNIDLNGFIVTFDLDFDARVRGTIAGTGAISKIGVGWLRLTGDSSYIGWTMIHRGVIAAEHVHALGAAGSDNLTLVLDDGALRLPSGVVDERLFVSGLVVQADANAVTTLTGEVTLDTGSEGALHVGGTLTVTGPIAEDDPGGFLYKQGLGTLVVSNPGNRWSAMVIRQGRVCLGAAGALPDAATVELSNDPSAPTLELNGIDETIGPLFGDAVGRVLLGSATLTINSVSPSIYAGAIAGGGTLRKTGASSQTFKGAQPLSFTGTTLVQAGTLVLEKNAGAGVLGPVVVNGGFLILGATDQIADAAAVTVNAPGTLSVVASGETVGSLTGTGEVSLVNHAGLTVGANHASTIFAGTISGTGQFTKVGNGTLTLSGTSPQSPDAGAGQGTLLINGTLAPLAVAFAEGATLGGTGRVGHLEASEGLNRGVISPGAGPGPVPGILHAASADIPAATLVIELKGPEAGTGYDQLDVTGSVILFDAQRPSTASLKVTRGFTPQAGTRFTIVNVGAGGTITGTFDGLAEGATLSIDGQRFSITYQGGDGNDIALTALEGPPARSYFLSEGATGSFFDDDVLIANPNDALAPVTLTFFKENGEQIVTSQTLAAKSHATIHVDQLPGLDAVAASVRVTSEDGLPLLVERTMFWDSTSYAGHTGSAVDEPKPDWFFAEGSQGFFDTFVLVVNPHANATEVTFTFLLEHEPPVVKTMPLGAFSRLTLDAGTVPEIVDRSFGITVHATQPIMAERSMYFATAPTRLWSGGHESAGVTAAATHWFLAEGATGSFFDTFILLSNPQDIEAHVTLDYLLDAGDPIRVTKTLAPRTRLTTNIEAENDPRLRDAAVSTVVTSDVPIIAERSMYWPGAAPPWGEGHNSFGVVNAHTHWGLAEGRVGGPLNFHTYILLANPELSAAEVTLTYLRESGPPVVKTYVVPPRSRFTIDTSSVSELQHESFGAEIVVTNGVRIVVERSLYWDAQGISFSGGTNATGMAIP